MVEPREQSPLEFLWKSKRTAEALREDGSWTRHLGWRPLLAWSNHPTKRLGWHETAFYLFHLQGRVGGHIAPAQIRTLCWPLRYFSENHDDHIRILHPVHMCFVEHSQKHIGTYHHQPLPITLLPEASLWHLIMQLDQFHCAQGHQLIPPPTLKVALPKLAYIVGTNQMLSVDLQCLLSNHCLFETVWKLHFRAYKKCDEWNSTKYFLCHVLLSSCNMKKPSECINHCLIISVCGFHFIRISDLFSTVILRFWKSLSLCWRLWLFYLDTSY